ncbi:MAG: fructose-specific PTS transporter subunit EIIC [Clostridiales bacterium]|nr:fructose-specific PTS transporter subunit EIIC [Clostridiales bacterium]
MKIRDLLSPVSINLNGQPGTKDQVIRAMVDLMVKSGKIKDADTYRKGVFAREEEGTTGIGEGIAIPHCKSDAVSAPGLAAMVIPKGTDFDSLDGDPVDLIFLIAAPNTKENVHLDVLSKLSTLLMDEDFTKALRSAKSVDEFLAIIDRAEQEKDAQEAAKGEVSMADKKVFVLAVTACPTGIAHTYMAAEALEKKAAEMGVAIKVETRGSGGAKNVMTSEEISKATAIIVAADTKVPMDRFDGYKVIECKVADGINKSEELITRAVNGDAPVYHAADGAKASKSQESEAGGGAGHMIYTHLMNGVSHMLPFVIGGGIMTALAFLIDTLLGYGATGGSNFGSMTPLSAFFKYTGGLAMGLMVPVLAGYIAYSIADRPGLAVGFTGGLLASSGNAAAASYIWNDSTSGFQSFLANFGFQTANGGNTVSGFLGGIVAGFLAGYIVLMLKKLCSKLPDSLEGIKPTFIYPLVGIFLISVLMCFIFNPLIGLINTGLSNMLTSLNDMGLITVLGLILGAMMAIDMGGPINKAAYVFGTGMLATASQLMENGASSSDPAVQACYIAMASIMIGGMVPPVGIALACQFFPKKFTEAERSSKLSNFVMGASFITEGAIPFAASDPLHVIPCTLVGAGVAGFMSALFGCTLMAPHGGIFVFATVGKPLMYILSWVVGSVITAVMLGVIKKDAVE